MRRNSVLTFRLHAHLEAPIETAAFATCAVTCAVDIASIILLAKVGVISLIGSSKEAFAAFARQCAIVHSSRYVVTHFTSPRNSLMVHVDRSAGLA